MDILRGPNIGNATQAASKSMAWQWANTGWALTIGGGRVRWAFQEFWCGLYIVKSECIYYFEEADAIKIMPKAEHAKGRCSFPFLVRWVYLMQSMSIVDSSELLKVDEEGAATTVILVHIHALLGVTRSPAQSSRPGRSTFSSAFGASHLVFLSHFTVFAW
ncbi:uncharacterized protein [Triticum aestivum]|uniref:uncharacterized protein isoform X2 n=1 Tax=Triticum aestivum TaxID=4565 RepID=UPI001D02F704|nr:uncharacterized protein LOC123097532 isoform X2 [Triticum aestivum]